MDNQSSQKKERYFSQMLKVPILLIIIVKRIIICYLFTDNTIIEKEITNENALKYNLKPVESNECNDNDDDELVLNEPTTSGNSSWSRQAILNLIEQYKQHEKDFKNTAIKKSKV